MPNAKKYEIFISHRAEDHAIAATIKSALERLSNEQLEIHVWEDIQGGIDWRAWIEEKIYNSKLLVFLYTDPEADWHWCIYELGLFRGKEASKKSGIICLKDPYVGKPLSPIQDFQAYNANNEGIARFFKDIVYNTELLGERLNDDLFSKEEMKTEYDQRVDRLVRYFIPSVKKEFFINRITITLGRAVEGKILVVDIEEASISGLPETMSLLQLQTPEPRWRDLFTTFQENDQKAWLEQLHQSIGRIKRGKDPITVMEPFALQEGKTFLPVVSRAETFRDKDRQGDVIPKQLTVLFIPMPKRFETICTLPDILATPNNWSTYPPMSVVRVKWSKQSEELGYRKEDMIDEPVICNINPEFARLFDLDYNAFPSPDGPKRLTAARLFECIKGFMESDHFEDLKDDQERIGERIILENKKDLARVPLQFDDRHPYCPGETYLPYLICKERIGEPSGPHQTYLLVCYVKDFLPTKRPRSFHPEAIGARE